VFDDKRLIYKNKVTDTMAWSDIPTCKEAGVDMSYLMLRGIFMSSGVSDAQRDYYVELFRKVRETPEWKEFMERGAFNQTALTGKEYFDWVAKEEQRHRELMKEAGFLAK
jgi:tripartite-type tricarboxylate transporter receptor subunit TctC